jgi:uncharacterized protein (DUF427 family)
MIKATWNGAVIAQTDDSVVVDGNVYFPRDAVDPDHLQASETHTTCGWKGVASYYDVVVEGEVNRDAAWYYPDPKDAAETIRDRIAFWNGVTVSEA